MNTPKAKRIICLVMLSLALMPLVADAQMEQRQNAIATAREVKVRADMQEILDVLQPVNLRQMDRASKKLFEDFFSQKNMIYGTAGIPTKQPALEQPAPPRAKRKVL